MMGFEELAYFWENLWQDGPKWNCNIVWNFFAVILVSLSFSTNCKLICNSHLCGTVMQMHIVGTYPEILHVWCCQNLSLQNFWIMELCVKIWHLILFLLPCLIVAIKFYREKHRTFRGLAWKCLENFYDERAFLETRYVRNKWDNDDHLWMRQQGKKPQSSQDWYKIMPVTITGSEGEVAWNSVAMIGGVTSPLLAVPASNLFPSAKSTHDFITFADPLWFIAFSTRCFLGTSSWQEAGYFRVWSWRARLKR